MLLVAIRCAAVYSLTIVDLGFLSTGLFFIAAISSDNAD